MKLAFTLLLVMLSLLSARLFAGPLQLAPEYEVFNGTAIHLGKNIDLHKVIGHRPVYLKLWASWCLDCRKQMPDLEATYQKYRDQIAIYAVNLNINEDTQTLQRIVDKYHLTLPIVLDSNSSIAGNFNFAGTPFHVLINAQGQVVYTTYHADEKLHKKLEQLARSQLLAPAEELLDKGTAAATLNLPNGLAIRYFTASWCSWYFADIEPAMASNCIAADKTAKQLFADISAKKISADWQSFATYLWAEPKDIEDYRHKQALDFAIVYDQNNAHARAYKVTQYPSLLVFRDGTEIGRITRFEDQAATQKQLDQWLAKH